MDHHVELDVDNDLRDALSASQASGTVVDKGSESPAKSQEDLKKYFNKKQAVATAIHLLQDLLKSCESEARAAECHDLMVKLAEDRFTLAVVGQFKRGKSSLMNAVIGRDVLPTGMLPLTSAVTILRFGPRERLLIQHEGWAFHEEAPISALADYVTEKGNPGNRRQIKAVYVEVPSPFLRRGLEFVDTPGVGSAIEANTATTYSFLPRCDAVLFVTSLDTPLTATEMGFLRDLRQYVRKVFFVVNKADLIPEHERLEILNFISATLRRETSADEQRVIPLSARTALAAKMSGDAKSIASSGVVELECELAKFLVEEKSMTFLVAILDKAITLLRSECHEIDLQALVRDKVGGGAVKLAQLKDRIAQCRASYNAHFAEVRAEIARDVMGAFYDHLASFVEQEMQTLRKEAKDWVRSSRWEMLQTIARGFAGVVRPRLEVNLSVWAAEQATGIARLLSKAVEREHQSVMRQVAIISRAADEIFGVADFNAACASADVKPSCVLSFSGRIPTPPAWRPRILIPWRFVPVRLNETFCEKMLLRQAERWLLTVRSAVSNVFQQRLNEALDRLGQHLNAKIEHAESQVLQVIARATANALPGNSAATLMNDAEQSQYRVQLERRLEGLRAQIVSGADVEPSLKQQAPASEEPVAAVIMAEERRRTDPLTPSEDLVTRGCPVCHHVTHAIFDFFRRTQYALASNEQAQRLHAHELGFCPLHTWHLASIASPLGLSIGYPRLAERLSADLSILARDPQSAAASVQKLCARPQTCRACQFLSHSEGTYVQQMATLFADPVYQEAYSRSQGVCLHHLAMLVKAISAQETVRFLLSEAARHFAELNEDMQSYRMKREATRTALVNEDEADAYLRMLTHIAGERYLATTQPADAEL